MSVVPGWGFVSQSDGFFLLIDDLSAGGRPQSTPHALARVTVSGLCRFITAG
jgi:hypothetical protein